MPRKSGCPLPDLHSAGPSSIDAPIRNGLFKMVRTRLGQQERFGGGKSACCVVSRHSCSSAFLAQRGNVSLQ